MIKKIIAHPIATIFVLFLSWRIFLVVLAIFAINYIPLGFKDRFLGGGVQNYTFSPLVFSWANFDGEHYLSISIVGYKDLEQAFFPVYPMLISIFARPYSFDAFTSLLSSTITGLLIANISFLLALLFLFELICLDYPKKIAFLTIATILAFPTSFYFGSLYSESLFLLLSVLSFYFARKNRWLLSSIFGFLSSATRIFGLLLLPALLFEIYKQKGGFSKTFWIFLIPLGLGVYMLYQYLSVGDPLAFYHLQKLVGEQHQSGLILLPQVYFRYLRILLTSDPTNPIYQTILLEFAVGLVFFLLPIYGFFKKVRLSYLVFAMLGFLTPTIQGSFSSLPRYVLVFFPSFLILAIFVNSLPKLSGIIYFVISCLLLVLETGLFLRGYWVA